MQCSLFPSDSHANFTSDHIGERNWIGNGAWIDYAADYLDDHDQVFDQLATGCDWVQERRQMYDRIVDVPRLTANLTGDSPASRLLTGISKEIGLCYGVTLSSIALAWYRNGNDSVAPHGDKIGNHMEETVIATLSVGAERRFILRPITGGKSRELWLGGGDLLVMGGTCQRTWLHGIPKTSHAEPRICIVFRQRPAVS